MKELNANGLYLSIAQALQKMEEEQGNSFSLEQVNLAELERLTGISRGKLRRLKKNGFQEVAHANKGVKHQKTKDGTINFDTSSALDAGYNEAAVTGIANHLNNINERVLAGEMIVDDTFTAYSIDYLDSVKQFSSDVSTFDVTQHPVYGFSGTISKWYGDTYIYLNKMESYCLRDAFQATQDTCESVIDTLAELSSDPDWNVNEYAGYQQKALDLIIVGAGIVGMGAYLYKNQVINAMAPGYGIQWLIHNDYNSGTIGWGFSAQNWDAIDW